MNRTRPVRTGNKTFWRNLNPLRTFYVPPLRIGKAQLIRLTDGRQVPGRGAQHAATGAEPSACRAGWAVAGV